MNVVTREEEGRKGYTQTIQPEGGGTKGTSVQDAQKHARGIGARGKWHSAHEQIGWAYNEREKYIRSNKSYGMLLTG